MAKILDFIIETVMEDPNHIFTRTQIATGSKVRLETINRSHFNKLLEFGILESVGNKYKYQKFKLKNTPFTLFLIRFKSHLLDDGNGTTEG